MRHTFHIYAGKEVHNYLCSQLQKEMTENRMEFGFVSNQNDTWGGQMWQQDECNNCLDDVLILWVFHFSLVVGDGLVKPEALNKKAIQIINRVRDKLTGKPLFM